MGRRDGLEEAVALLLSPHVFLFLCGLADFARGILPRLDKTVNPGLSPGGPQEIFNAARVLSPRTLCKSPRNS